MYCRIVYSELKDKLTDSAVLNTGEVGNQPNFIVGHDENVSLTSTMKKSVVDVDRRRRPDLGFPSDRQSTFI